jgi:hypothetical protein
VREDLEQWLPEEYPALLTLVAELRTELLREGIRLSAEQWRDVTAGCAAGFLRDGDPDGAERELRAQVKAMARVGLPGWHGGDDRQTAKRAATRAGEV